MWLKSERKSVNAGGGRYLIFLFLSRDVVISLNSLGTHQFPAGWYVYAGRHRRSLRSRVERHLKKTKRLHWHIDSLTTQPEVTGRFAWRETGTIDECGLVRMMLEQFNARVLIHGFGSSDCKAGCPAHLLYLHVAEVEKLKMWCQRNGEIWR